MLYNEKEMPVYFSAVSAKCVGLWPERTNPETIRMQFVYFVTHLTICFSRKFLLSFIACHSKMFIKEVIHWVYSSFARNQNFPGRIKILPEKLPNGRLALIIAFVTLSAIRVCFF
jgi:hypothetical protein